MNLDKLSTVLPGMVNWFDLVVLVMVILGAGVGRKRGMSMEIGACLQWIFIVIAGAALYKPFGDMLAESWPFSRLFCYLASYIGAALIVKFLFGILTRRAGGKLWDSNTFGWGEYYFGTIAGAVRFACIILAAMALLNARSYSTMPVAAKPSFSFVSPTATAAQKAAALGQKEMFNASLVPNIATLQNDVFNGSLTGKYVKKYLDCVLITQTKLEKKNFKRRDALPAGFK